MNGLRQTNPSNDKFTCQPGLRRAVTALVGGVVILTASMFFAVASASADANGTTCGGTSDPTRTICRGVQIYGSGTWVSQVCDTAFVEGYNNGVYGYKRMWGDGFYFEGPHNQFVATWPSRQCWTINRNLKTYTWVCASWHLNSPSADLSPACDEILP
jgi:hypothetical protein